MSYLISKTEAERVTVSFNKDVSQISAKNYLEIQEEAVPLFDRVSAEAEEVNFDLTGIGYVSSAGLRMFAFLNTEAKKRGMRFALVNLRKDILKMFQLTGCSNVYKITEAEEF